MRRSPLLLVLLLALIVPFNTAIAGKGEIRFVETDVDLREDGTAVVAYTVQWNVLSGELHGFYFEGSDRLRIQRFSSDSYAVDSRGTRYGLSITPVSGDKWDIVLAGGRGVSSGTLTYVYHFLTSFAEAGYVAPTTAIDGRELVVFNWSPVRWDEAARQDHYTLKVLTPHPLPAGVDPRAYVEQHQLVLTERSVNEKLKIDYQRGEQDRLRLVFHRERPGNRFDMRVQFYLPAEWFSLQPTAAGEARPGPEGAPDASEPSGWARRMPRRFWFIGGGVALLVLFFLVVSGKQRSMVSAHQGLEKIRWDALDWTPPKLVLSTMRKPGKVCEDLTPLEAALYLGIPFKRIVSAMLDSMVAEGWLEIVSGSPLRVKLADWPDTGKLDMYETHFFQSVADDGELSQEELEALMNLAVTTIQQKAWDADVEATKKYYAHVIEGWELLIRLLIQDMRTDSGANSPRGNWINWLGYGLSMLVGVYTHYFPLLLLPAHYIFFVLHYKRFKLPLLKWLIAAGIVGFAGAVWVGLSMLGGAGKLAAPPWIQPARLYEPILSLVTFSAGRTFEQTQPTSLALFTIFLVGIAVVILMYWRIRKTAEDVQVAQNKTLFARLLLIWLFVPMLIAFVVSLEWPVPGRPPFSIYVDRYLIIALPAFLLLATWGIVILAQRARWLWLPAVTALAVLALVTPGLLKIYGDPSVGREEWRSALGQLETDINPSDAILLRPDVLLPLAYYTDLQSPIVELPASTSDEALIDAFSAEMERSVREAAEESDRAWLITNFYVSDPHGITSERNELVTQAADHNPQRAWMEENYPAVGDWEYTGIRITLFDLTSENGHGRTQ